MLACPPSASSWAETASDVLIGSFVRFVCISGLPYLCGRVGFLSFFLSLILSFFLSFFLYVLLLFFSSVLLCSFSFLVSSFPPFLLFFFSSFLFSVFISVFFLLDCFLARSLAR